MDYNLVQINKPESIGLLSNWDIVNGLSIPAIDRLKIMSAGQFEDFVYEWAYGYLKNHSIYKDVQKCAGAGDMGRDIVGIISERGDWVNYQCKHYDSALIASKMATEIGKIIYYSYLKKYNVPTKYYFVAPRGVGTGLQDLINNSEELKKYVKDGWIKYCESEITKTTKTTKIILTGDLLIYFDKFDFTIFEGYEPLKLIEEHAKTQYHRARFGGGLKKRIKPDLPPNEIKHTELNYVQQLYDLYSEKMGFDIKDYISLSRFSHEVKHFNEQRLCFYHAECLNQFSRDQLPDDIDYFEELKDEVYHAVNDIMEDYHENNFRKFLSVLKQASLLVIERNPLKSYLDVQDKKGLCHHLANDKRLIWTNKNNGTEKSKII
jgi:hypothetical protein